MDEFFAGMAKVNRFTLHYAANAGNVSISKLISDFDTKDSGKRLGMK